MIVVRRNNSAYDRVEPETSFSGAFGEIFFFV